MNVEMRPSHNSIQLLFRNSECECFQISLTRLDALSLAKWIETSLATLPRYAAYGSYEVTEDGSSRTTVTEIERYEEMTWPR